MLRELCLCAAEEGPDATLETAARNWRIGGLWVSEEGVDRRERLRFNVAERSSWPALRLCACGKDCDRETGLEQEL